MKQIHKRYLIHRDLRIENIAISGSKLKLINFGLNEIMNIRNEAWKKNFKNKIELNEFHEYLAPEIFKSLIQLKKVEYIIQLLKAGKNLALVSDAGTPGISDPGNKLVNAIITSPGLVRKIVSVPGPSAVTTAASISGFPMDKFIFLVFPPTKRKRKKFFEEVLSSKYPVVFYESPHRILKTLSELQSLVISHKSLVNVVVCRELTKKFETIYRGTIEEVLKQIEESEIKGEFVVIVGGK